MLPHPGQFFGNPSSSHHYADAPRQALAASRARIAALIGARPGEIVFTASGSEADQLAVRGAALASGRRRPHVIIEATEHPAVLETCRALQRLHQARGTVLPADSHGRVDPAALAAALDEDPVLVSVITANNETGRMQPVADLASLARQPAALLHSDAAPAART